MPHTHGAIVKLEPLVPSSRVVIDSTPDTSLGTSPNLQIMADTTLLTISPLLEPMLPSVPECTYYCIIQYINKARFKTIKPELAAHNSWDVQLSAY